MDNNPRIAIIGAGPGGISLALSLQQGGMNDFVIFERESGVGGVWYQNRYPGCRCDIDALYYSHSRFPHDWGESHPPRETIQQYWHSICDQQSLLTKIQFNTSLRSSTWNPSTSKYNLVLSKGGEQVQEEYTYLISAIGAFSTPSKIDIPGIDLFNGKIVQPIYWPEELGLDELEGKKVVVIGNGCTGTQLITALSKRPSIQIVAVSRSVRWLVPSPTKEGPHTTQWTTTQRFLYSVPPFRWLARLGVYLFMEMYWILFTKEDKRLPIARKIQKKFATFMYDSAPEGLKDKIVPDFPLGSNRITFDGGYLNALKQPNVTPICGILQRIESEGIVLGNGKRYDADYIVLATGYNTAASLNIQGREEYNMTGKRDNLEYYHGMAIPGFPNFFSLQGNNSTAGHFSSLFQLEVQADYIASLLSKSSELGNGVIEVKEDSTKRYNEWIDSRIDNTVWADKHSWYHANGGQGRVFTHWPGPATLYWWINRKINWDDWVISRS